MTANKRIDEQALTFNGQTYKDAAAYNAAVDAYNNGMNADRAEALRQAKGYTATSNWSKESDKGLTNYVNAGGDADRGEFRRSMREQGLNWRQRNRAWKAYNKLDKDSFNKKAEAYKAPDKSQYTDWSSFKMGGKLPYAKYLHL